MSPSGIRPFRWTQIVAAVCITSVNASASSICEGTALVCPINMLEVEECSECGDYNVPDVDTKKCIQRHVFGESHLWNDLGGIICWFFGAGLAMSAGVGGGGIFVPLGLILLRFGAKAATGLSQASIFGASLGGLLINIRSKHPTANRPVIDLDMALFLAPTEMAGAIVGVIVQKILPDWAVIVTMAVILGYTAFRTFKKGFQTYEKEKKANETRGLSEEMSSAKAAELKECAKVLELDEKTASTIEGTNFPVGSNVPEGEKVLLAPITSASGDNTSASKKMLSSPDTAAKEAVTKEIHLLIDTNSEDAGDSPDLGRATPNGERSPKLDVPTPEKTRVSGGSLGTQRSMDEWLEKDASCPKKQYGYLGVLWVTLILILVFKGGKGLESVVASAIPYCGVGYWVLTACAFFWLFGFGAIMGRRAVSKSIRKQEVDFPFVEGDVLWDWNKVNFYAFWTFISGVVAGLIGIGGGMVLGPLMLQMGVLPQVSTATTATMIALTSSSVAVMYVMGGLVPWSYALVFFITAFLGALIGKTKIDKEVKKRNLTSILIFILAFIILFATTMVTLAGALKYSDQDWCFESVQPVCKK